MREDNASPLTALHLREGSRFDLIILHWEEAREIHFSALETRSIPGIEVDFAKCVHYLCH